MSEQLNVRSQEISRERTPFLGEVAVNKGPLEIDLKVADRFQSFSAEVLRLSLLGIAAIGFFITNILLKGPSQSDALIVPISRRFLFGSLICFGLSAGCALMHRYFLASTLEHHLKSLRFDKRRANDDISNAAKERGTREWQYMISSWMLFGAATLLGIAALALVVALSLVICR